MRRDSATALCRSTQNQIESHGQQDRAQEDADQAEGEHAA